jgi:hypothetical protein
MGDMETELDLPAIFFTLSFMDFFYGSTLEQFFPDPLKRDCIHFYANLSEEDSWQTAKLNKPACGNAWPS